MKKKIETILSSIGIKKKDSHGAVVDPLYLSTNYKFKELGDHPEFDYSRSGNPTRQLLENALAELEGGEGAVVTNSGMSAVMLLSALVPLKGNIVLPHDCYGGTFRLFKNLEKRGLLTAHYLNQADKDFHSKVLSIQPDLIWIETPSNPLLRLVDISHITALASEIKALTVADNTFLSPALQNPIALGVDFVMHSSTKYINGHSDVIAGAVISKTKDQHEKLYAMANDFGVTGSPFDSYQTIRGLRTLALRMDKHNTNAIFLAEGLNSHPKILKVHYPGLHSHPNHELAKNQQQGFGGMLSFEIDLNTDEINHFLSKLEIFTLAESLGGFESLICHPSSMTHAPLTAEDKREAGIHENLLRISVGLENKEDLLNDLLNALK
jgi:cystathionine gamma-synthase